LSEIDFRKIGDCKTGPITRSIQKVFHDAIRGKNPKYADWVEYVNDEQVSVEVDQSTSVSAD
jgi:branched-chain amino acid aminotransferase